MIGQSRRLSGYLILLPGLFFAATFGLPLFMVVQRSVGAGSDFAGIFASSYYRGLFGFTAKQAGLSTLFSVVFGLPGAYLVGRCRFPGRRVMKSLSTVPFVLPPVLAVLGFVLVFGNSGIVNSIRSSFVPEGTPWKILYSLPAIIMAHVFYNFPLTLRIVGDSWARLPVLHRRAARSLGAGRFKAFLYADLPRLLPSVITAALLTFLYCFMSFSIVLVLGGGPKLSTLEVEIYRLVKHQLDFSKGSTLAALESILLFSLLGLYAYADSILRSRTIDDGKDIKFRETKDLGRTGRLLTLCYVIPALFFVVGPLVSIVVQSFITRATRLAPLTFSLVHWERLILGTGRGGLVSLASVARSVILACVVSGLTTFTASIIGWYSAKHLRLRKFFDSAMALPLGVSSIILGLGWLLVLQRLPRFDFAHYLALVVAHSLGSLPFCYRIVAGRLRQISRRIPQAARSLGAGPMKSYLVVELPMARRALITSAVFSFALSAGELNATAILAPGNFTTVPLAIYRLIGAYDFSGACALGTVLILICFTAFIIFDRYAEL